MRKTLIAIGLAAFLATPAVAQTMNGSPSGTTAPPEISNPPRQGQYGPSGNPSRQFGTDDQKAAPNSACPPGSTSPACQSRPMIQNGGPATRGEDGADSTSSDTNSPSSPTKPK